MLLLRFSLLFTWLYCWNLVSANVQERLSINQAQQSGWRQPNSTLPAILDALDVLQGEYFAIWQGVWPTSIDWTSAVIGTYLSSALSTVSTSFPSLHSDKLAENIVNKYFSQLVSSYFGQDDFALRNEAFDDMLWVVLGWLESVKFIKAHSTLHFGDVPGQKNAQWYGEQWTPAFAHRARVFWEMASHGWDTSLCNGGMIWSPYLLPYKNAITNELYIAASISMYLYFPGDNNTSPFTVPFPTPQEKLEMPRESRYLIAAIDGYKWLMNSNMTDAQGLFVDGYHVSGLSWPSHNRVQLNTKCDSRNEMVYTYNQGVLLSGQRGLYEATGARSYLEDGHTLISDVIAATGWDLHNNNLVGEKRVTGKLGQWRGLGRSGILEEFCDAEAYCSQDSQTFKGIFFHHLTLFCANLPDRLILPEGLALENETPSNPAQVRKWHSEMCGHYGPWIKHNALAALDTVDHTSKFGMWWGAPSQNTSQVRSVDDVPSQAVDYRNLGVPDEWKYPGSRWREIHNVDTNRPRHGFGTRDLNDRGRGRTVETQGGGISVLRAYWEIVESKSN